jgi:hypothetical protein
VAATRWRAVAVQLQYSNYLPPPVRMKARANKKLSG